MACRRPAHPSVPCRGRSATGAPCAHVPSEKREHSVALGSNERGEGKTGGGDREETRLLHTPPHSPLPGVLTCGPLPARASDQGGQEGALTGPALCPPCCTHRCELPSPSQAPPPIVQRRRQRHRDVVRLARAHTASKWPGRGPSIFHDPGRCLCVCLSLSPLSLSLSKHGGGGRVVRGRGHVTQSTQFQGWLGAVPATRRGGHK